MPIFHACFSLSVCTESMELISHSWTSPFLPHVGGTLPSLPYGLNVLLGLHPERDDTGVARVAVFQRQRVHEAWAVEGKWRRRRRSSERGWSVTARRSSEEGWRSIAGWRGEKGREGVQRRGGGGDTRWCHPGFESRRSGEGEQGWVLQLDGADGAQLQLLLPTPFSTTVLEPHLWEAQHITTGFYTAT